MKLTSHKIILKIWKRTVLGRLHFQNKKYSIIIISNIHQNQHKTHQRIEKYQQSVLVILT